MQDIFRRIMLYSRRKVNTKLLMTVNDYMAINEKSEKVHVLMFILQLNKCAISFGSIILCGNIN